MKKLIAKTAIAGSLLLGSPAFSQTAYHPKPEIPLSDTVAYVLTDAEKNEILRYKSRITPYLKVAEYSYGGHFSSIDSHIETFEDIAKNKNYQTLEDEIEKTNFYLDKLDFFKKTPNGLYKTTVASDLDLVVAVGEYEYTSENSSGEYYESMYRKAKAIPKAATQVTNFLNDSTDMKEKQKKDHYTLAPISYFTSIKVGENKYKYVIVFKDIGKRGKYNEIFIPEITGTLPSEYFDN